MKSFPDRPQPRGHLKVTWKAFFELLGPVSEVADPNVIAKRDHFRIRPLAQRLEAQMQGNKFKANTVVAIKLARSVYFMLKNKTVFDPDRLVAALARN